MSVEAWEGMQRHGQDIAERFSSLAQGFSCLLHSHMSSSGIPGLSAAQVPNGNLDCKNGEQGIPIWPWPWPSNQQRKNTVDRVQFSNGTGRRNTVPVAADSMKGNGATTILELGQRLGQAGADFGARLGGIVQNVARHVPLPFHQDSGNVLCAPLINQPQSDIAAGHMEWREADEAASPESTSKVPLGRIWKGYGPKRQSCESREDPNEFDDIPDEDVFSFQHKPPARFHKHQGSVTVTTTYDSRTRDIESSVVARGDLWRAEASHGGSSSGNPGAPLFLLQLGPILFVRDTTLLLPVHLSKQHLLWYGFDRKNGLHSLCPAVWSKQRRWLLMSMICLNPLACSFMDLQFPNGQLTYVAGEGLTTSAFLPAFGGLLQAQGRYPGEAKLSFSCKNRWGTCVTPAVQWPDKSFSLGMTQPLAWQRSGLMVRPTIQLSVTSAFGGRNAGWRAELIHSVRERLSFSCGYAFTIQPSAFASVSVGRSKWNGHSGSSGLVLRVESPLENVGRASFSLQLNSGVEF